MLMNRTRRPVRRWMSMNALDDSLIGAECALHRVATTTADSLSLNIMPRFGTPTYSASHTPSADAMLES